MAKKIKLKKKLNNSEIIMEIYRRMYKEAEPSADINKIIKSGERKKPVWFMEYYLPQERQDEITEEALKEFKVPNYKKQEFRNEIWLGSAPRGVEKMEIKMKKKKDKHTTFKILKNLGKVGILVPDITKKQPCKEPLVLKYHIKMDELREEVIKYVKRQQIPKSYNKIELFFHCKKCFKKGNPSGSMEVGFSKSKSLILVQCKNCKGIVQRINLAQVQNDWIEYFFNITKKEIGKK